jgi:hypothetical protein
LAIPSVTVIGKWAAAGAFAVLVLAGCGGRAESGQRPAVSPAQFAARANTICREQSSPAERIAALRRLRPPAAVKDLYAHWLTAERDALRVAEGGDMREGDDPLVPRAIAEGKITGYARRLGANACASAQVGRIRP